MRYGKISPQCLRSLNASIRVHDQLVHKDALFIENHTETQVVHEHRSSLLLLLLWQCTHNASYHSLLKVLLLCDTRKRIGHQKISSSFTHFQKFGTAIRRMLYPHTYTNK